MAIVFAMGIYYINRLIAKGPEGRAVEPPELGTPARPLSASKQEPTVGTIARLMRRAGLCDRVSCAALEVKETAMEWYLPVDLGRAHRHRGRACTSSSTASISASAFCFPSRADESERDQMMNSVAPFWDGNETWLVLGGGGLLVAFPRAYAVIMPAFYLPVIVMLLALVFRGVAFEFRWVAVDQQALLELRLRGRLDAWRRSARA